MRFLIGPVLRDRMDLVWVKYSTAAEGEQNVIKMEIMEQYDFSFIVLNG